MHDIRDQISSMRLSTFEKREENDYKWSILKTFRKVENFYLETSLEKAYDENLRLSRLN